MNRRVRPLALGFVLVFLGCATSPRPQILGQLAATSQAPAVLEARELAAPSWARAEELRRQAEAGVETAPIAEIQRLAEESLARYEEAVALARLAKAERRAVLAEATVDQRTRELSATQAQLARVESDVRALETRLSVAKNVLPPPSSEASDEERTSARLAAARALAVQGRLLCAAARVFGAAPPAAGGAISEDPLDPARIGHDWVEAERALVEVEAEIARAAPAIDAAGRARAACLSVLSRTRRALQGSSSKASERSADALLGRLSEMLASPAASKRTLSNPSRDERGVYVSIPTSTAFDRGELHASVVDEIAALDRVAAAHPEFALALVVHSAKPARDADARRLLAERGERIAARFSSVPAARRVVLVADDALPLVDGRSRRAEATNERVEIVFLAPTAL